MSERTIKPCIHPTCDDGTGNRSLTTLVMCDRCRRHYRRQLDWLIEDYITLKSSLPRPMSRQGVNRGHPESFGHPAEWASDHCRDIAGMLNDAEDELRAITDSGPAIYVDLEAHKVASAYRYLTDRWETFCTFPQADVYADMVISTHQTIRAGLGLTKWARKLPVPCPSCDVAALTQSVGLITCGDCGREIREADYPLFARIALDYLIDAYDTQNSA